MREITIIRDGILPRLPGITKIIRNAFYIILALSLIAAALIKRADYLDPSNMVTNIAVIAMVAYPVAAIFALAVKFILRLFTSDEFTVTSRRIFGYETLGRPVEISLDDIASAASGKFILKTLTVIGEDGRKHIFIGLRSAERIVSLVTFLADADSNGCVNAESAAYNAAAELQKYSGLQKSGIITASEFENIKKQIIGL